MSATGKVIVGLGELLWDLLPAGRQLGGAPANFAYMAQVLGDSGVIASRVGQDELGAAARARLAELGMSADYVQTDENHPTGAITVTLNKKGEPSYAGTQDAAWDHLEF